MSGIEIWCPKCNTIWLVIANIKDVSIRLYKECAKCLEKEE